jgi:hypothetical protein
LKQYLPQGTVNTLVLGLLFRHAQTDDGEVYEEAIISSFEGWIGRARIVISVESLFDSDYIKFTNDFGENRYMITRSGYQKGEELYLADEPNGTLRRLVDQGVASIFSATELDGSIAEGSVPASDRIVSRSDNLEVIEALTDDLEALGEEIQSNNEIGAALGDDREVIGHELAVARDTLDKERFRISSLLAWLLPALRFLAKRFAGTSVDEIAVRLIQALEKLT